MAIQIKFPAFYILIRRNDYERPYFMGKTCAPDKKSAIHRFANTTWSKTEKNWYTEEELIHFVKTPAELTDKERYWLAESKCL